VSGLGAFNGSPKAVKLKHMGAVRSRTVSRVKGTEEAPAIMQSPNHRGKLKSRAN